MWTAALIDSCVMMDALLPFRKQHQSAKTLLEVLAAKGIPCLIPSHAYFEYVVTLIIHFKREPNKVEAPIPPISFPNLQLNVVGLDQQYATVLLNELQASPIPDLKSQDMIFFSIARNRSATLITEDRRLRNISRKGGVRAFEIDEAIAELGATQA